MWRGAAAPRGGRSHRSVTRPARSSLGKANFNHAYRLRTMVGHGGPTPHTKAAPPIGAGHHNPYILSIDQPPSTHQALHALEAGGDIRQRIGGDVLLDDIPLGGCGRG